MKWTEDKLNVLTGCVCMHGLSEKREAFRMASRLLGVSVKAVESAYYRHSSYIKDRLEYLDSLGKENIRKSNTVFHRIAIYMRSILHKIKSWFTYYG